MADTTTSGEPVTATTLQPGDLIRISQDLGAGSYGNAKLAASALATWLEALPTAWSTLTGIPANVSGAISSLTGDATASGPGAAALTLATSGVFAGIYGSGTQVGAFNVDAKGRIISAGNFTLTPAFSNITGLPTTLAGYGITDALIFKTISVAGQSDIVADTTADTLTIVAGTNITLATNASTDTLTISASGTGGTPGGSNTQLQFNDNGAFGGIPNALFDGTNLTLQASSGGQVVVQGGAGSGGPAILLGGNDVLGGGGGDIYTQPGNGTPGGNWYAPNIKTADPAATDAIYNDSGVLTFSGQAGAYLASALMNQVNWWPIAGSTLPSMIGSTSTTSGFTWASIVGTAVTNAATRQARARGSTAASAGATGVYASTSVGAYTGAGLGMYAEFLTGVGTNLTGHQCFVGLTTNATSLGGDPSALTNVIGIGFDAADLSSGNWQFYTNDASGTATKIDTGIARGVAQLLFVQLYNLPNSVIWNVIVTDMVVGTVYSNLALATNTPATGSVMRIYQSVRTGATTTAAAIDSMRAFMKWKSG